MLAHLLDTRRECQYIGLRKWRKWFYGHELWFSDRQSSGFVDDKSIHLAHKFDGFGIPKEWSAGGKLETMSASI